MPQKQEVEIDIDLNDPEVEAAAAKIQAKFRGRQMFGKKAAPKPEVVKSCGACLS